MNPLHTPPAARVNDGAIAFTLRPSTAELRAEVRCECAPQGGEYFAVTLHNDTATEVFIDAVEIRWRWLAVGGDVRQVASGGTTMATWPTQVAPARGARGPVESGTWLLARRRDDCALAGFVSWRHFWSKLRWENGWLTMHVDGEGRRLAAGESVALETVWLVEGKDWVELLERYATEVARCTGAKLKPRPQFVGWSTWDYYGRGWTVAAIEENTAAMRHLAPQANLLQIDGGWWPARGDYTEVRADLGAEAMKQLAGSIRGRGMTAGIHFDGMRGDTASRVAREHPEYFLHDQNGRMISVPQLNDGDRLEHIYFDYSHPGALDYMRHVVRTLREEWGYDYLKIDFLSFGLAEDIRRRALDNDPARRIAPHDPGLTSVERMHRALHTWREAMGPDAFFLACSAPLGVVLGYADGLRTGYDVYPDFNSLRRCAQATAGCFHLHGRAAWADADYQIVRGPEEEDETRVRNEEKRSRLMRNEAEMWTIHVGLFGGTKLNSDKLALLRPERAELVRLMVALPLCRRYVPLDFWSRGGTWDDAFHVLLGEADERVCLALFNWSDEPMAYVVRGLRGEEGAELRVLAGKPACETTEDAIRVRLAPRHAAAWSVGKGRGFDELRHALRVEAVATQ
jgi:Alpha-galactosidase